MLSEEAINALADQFRQEDLDQLHAESKAMDECIEQFSPDRRRLLMAPYLTEGGVTEIAKQTNRTVNSLYKLLGRLRKKLADCVQRKISMAESGGLS